ncbi:MAG: pilus assembly protein [Boseongicola sp.]
MEHFFGHLRHLRRRKDGSVAVEFAFIGLIFAVTVLGVLEFGRAMHVRNQLSYAADFAVRQVMLDPDVAGSGLASAIRDQFFGHNPSDLTINMSRETLDGIPYRKFELSYPMKIFIPFVKNDLTLTMSRRTPAI